MKKITFLLAAILFAGLSMAQTLAEVVNLSQGEHDGSKITWSAVNGNITIEQLQGCGSTTVKPDYISAPRAYKAHIFKFTCKEGYTIAKVTITYNKKYYGSNFQVGNEVKGDTLVVNNTTLYTATLSNSENGTHEFIVTNPNGESTFAIQNNLSNGEGNTQLRPTEIKIAFIKTATTTPKIDCTNLNFAIVNLNVENQKTLSVVGENLTENITATLKEGTAFAVAGNLTNTGGDLTISVIATEAGLYSDELILKSGATEKVINITAECAVLNGLGTEKNPYTVADVIKLKNPGVNAWVVGYIVGSCTSAGKLNASDSNSNSNLVLADAANETENFIAVQLPNGNDIRALNVKENPTMLGAKVAICGSLESYCTLPGLKSPSNYVILESSSTTAVDNVTINQNITKFFENGQLIIVKDGVKFNAQGQVIK